MNPTEYKYSKEHEWLCPQPDDEAKIGITDYARCHLGEIIYFIELAAPGTQVERLGKIGEIESEKAVSDLLTPASGQVLESNQDAIDNPNLVNRDPYGDGWLIKLKLSKPSELEDLMSCAEYEEFIAQCEESSGKSN
jgi:glycine cleavage system H protein